MKKIKLFYGIFLFLVLFCAKAFSENITLVTYYPAPYGVYTELRAKKLAVGATYYDASSITFGTDATLLSEGLVGINTTTPTYTVDVIGDRIRLAESATGDAIALRVDGTALDLGWSGDNLYITPYDGVAHNVFILPGNDGNVGVGNSSPGSYRLNVSASTSGNGILTTGSDGYALFATSDFATATLYSLNTSNGSALYGYNTSSGIGVRGYSSSSYGLYGYSVSNSGVRGISVSGNGVYGYTSGSGGVRGDSTSGSGVIGGSTSGAGVYGASSTYAGVYGTCTSGAGVDGRSTSGIGVVGRSTSETGVDGRSTSGIGVVGVSIDSYGVRAESTNSYGLYAYSGGADAIHAVSDGNNGIYAWSSAAYAVYAYSTGGFGVYARSTLAGSAGCRAYNSAGYGVMSGGAVGYYDFYANGGGGDFGPFTGAHDVLIADRDIAGIKRGMVVVATGEVKTRQDEDGSASLSSTLPQVKLADKANDKNVLGAFVSLMGNTGEPKDYWYKGPGKIGIVNALGEGRVWVTNYNGDIEPGDYITTSTVAGYGQKQDDDLLHNYTLGKVTEKVDWNNVKDEVEYQGKKYKTYLIAVIYTAG